MRMIRSIFAAALGLMAILLLPVIVPALLIAKAVVPGVSLISQTSSPFTTNLAAYHSPASLTWSWVISLQRPRAPDVGRWLSCYMMDNGRSFGLQIARHELTLHLQDQMPYPAARSTA